MRVTAAATIVSGSRASTPNRSEASRRVIARDPATPMIKPITVSVTEGGK